MDAYPPGVCGSVGRTMSTSAERTYTVQGMTCEHCRASVAEEVAEVPGVTAVQIDLSTGRLTVAGERVDDDAVRAAVDEAGYEVVS